ncbi:cardiolipin synthase, partial [bacterium]
MDREIVNSAVAIAIALLDIVAIAMAFWRSHGVERTLMWIFAILAFPGVGALSFFFLANPYVKRTIRRKSRAALMVRDKARRPAGGSPDSQPLFNLAAALTSFAPAKGNRVELLGDNETELGEAARVIAGAQKFVWVEYYIIKRDETGLFFLRLLAERARAGVEVKLLYDAVGSMGLEEFLSPIVEAGGKVEAFHPVNPLRKRWSVHLRNHRKLIVVDGKVGLTGGMNVGDEYTGIAKRRGGPYFRDLQLLVEGPAVADLCEIFAEDWSFATDEALLDPVEPSTAAGYTANVAVTPSGPDQEVNASALLYFGGICAAKERIFLTSPYFIPDEPTLRALICASLRGVDVRILIPQRCDVPLVGAAGRSYFAELLAAGVRIFHYQPAMLHSKTMAVDSRWSFVGSANLDMRSFR